MKIPRNVADAALLALLNGAWTWKTPVSLHWQDWSNTTNQPNCYLRRSKETATQVLRGMNRYVLHYEAWVYAQYENSNPATDPYSTVINPIMDALDAAINPLVDTDINNLGNPSIAMCRWNGAADIADGTVDGQVCLVIPIVVSIGA